MGHTQLENLEQSIIQNTHGRRPGGSTQRMVERANTADCGQTDSHTRVTQMKAYMFNNGQSKYYANAGDVEDSSASCRPYAEISIHVLQQDVANSNAIRKEDTTQGAEIQCVEAL